MEYYRVQRADSIIVIPIINGKLLLPQKYYRHGINEVTLDFPGGRLEKDVSIEDCVKGIINREILVEDKSIKKIEVLNEDGWYVDSSFSSQKLYGVITHIDVKNNNFLRLVDIDVSLIGILEELQCMQCRTVFNEWIRGLKRK